MMDDLLLLVTIGDAAIPPAAAAVKAELPTPIRGAGYSGSAVGEGGTPPYTYAHTGGTLPPGLALAADGSLTGTPTTQGFYEFEITATDSIGGTSAVLFALTTRGGLIFETEKLPVAEHAVAYSTQFSVSGGTPPYTFSTVTGSVPGAVLTASGANAGLYTIATPNAPLATLRYLVTFRVTDSTGNYVDREYSVYILPALQFVTSFATSALVGLPFSRALPVRYGIAQPYPSIQPAPTWAVTAGALPGGLSLNPTTGVFSGTPTQAGLFAWTTTVTDPIGASISLPSDIYVHDTGDIDRVFSASFGDGSSTTHTIVHGLALADSAPRAVLVFDQSAGLPMPLVDVEWSAVDSDTIEITTATAPSPGQYLIKICG